MTREERDNAITILENEKKCVNRANKNDYCNRDCYNCELVKTDTEILTALDMAIKALQEQADNIPVMYYPQVDGITPTVVAQADGEKNCFNCKWYPDNGITKGFDEVCHKCSNSDKWEGLIKRAPWEDIAPPPKIPEAQADGEYILKKDVMGCIGQTSLHWELARKLRKLPSVAIPLDHDGCKDCKHQDKGENQMPCLECQHNYKDKWARKPHWIMKHRTINEVKYHTGLDDMGEEHTIKELIRYEVDEPYCSECGMKAGDTSQNYCCFCGVKMD